MSGPPTRAPSRTWPLGLGLLYSFHPQGAGASGQELFWNNYYTTFIKGFIEPSYFYDTVKYYLRSSVVALYRRVVSKSNNKAATGRTQGIINLLFCESFVSCCIANARICHQKTAKCSVGCMTEASPFVDEDQAFWCPTFAVYPEFAMVLGRRLVLLVSKDAGKKNSNSCHFVVPVEKSLNKSAVSKLIPEVCGVSLVGLLIGSKRKHGSSKCQLVFISVCAIGKIFLTLT